MQKLTVAPQRLYSYLCIVGFILLVGCAGSSVFVPNPKGSSQQKKSALTEKSVEKAPVSEDTLVTPVEKKQEASSEDELDFALAFAEPGEKPPLGPETSVPLKSGTEVMRIPKQIGSISVPWKMVRVALHQNIDRITIYSFGTVDIRAGRKSGAFSCRGRIAVRSSKKKGNKARAVLESSTKGRFAVFLPCTLLAKSTQNYFELEEQSYRGSLILSAGKNGTFSLINYCNVEAYLRGVVPLEIGKRSEEDIEAVKAQAVAARTYTYKRIFERWNAPFDLLATIEDQVYGGVNAEYPLSDRAIRLTKDKVLVYGDSLIYAYYHSTCGGITANVADVWNKHPAPYLCSIKDVDSNGKAYCSISRYFTWKESWRTLALSSIIRQYSGSAFPNLPVFKGSVRGISVMGRYPCGRVSICRITSSAGTFKYSGDKIRFVLRRNLADYPILRSDNFKIVSANAKQITVAGRGYGHGVGMCQMGAIGRARAGQSFVHILYAYYTGVNIATVKVKAHQDSFVYE